MFLSLLALAFCGLVFVGMCSLIFWRARRAILVPVCEVIVFHVGLVFRCGVFTARMLVHLFALLCCFSVVCCCLLRLCLLEVFSPVF